MELLSNPLTYIVGVIVVLAVLELKKGKKCSPNSKEANKCNAQKSAPTFKTKPTYASSTPKQKTASATKKTATKKVAKKKVAKKTTPKKSVKKT